MATSLLPELASGALFGSALFASGVYQPNIILAQLKLSSFHMVTTMLGASASSALILYAADRTKLATAKARGASTYGFFPYDGNVLGGALIGLGMAFTGACPGTALVQAGVGLKSGLLVTLGGLAGGLAYSILQPSMPAKKAQPSATSIAPTTTTTSPTEQPPTSPTTKASTLPTALGVDPALILTLWVPICLTILYLITTHDDSLRTLGNASLLIAPLYSGLAIGLAQTASMLLNGHAIGVSGAYADIGNWIAQLMPGRMVESKPLLTPTVAFATGMIGGAMLLSQQTLPGVVAAQDAPVVDVSRALAGGFAMIVGARVAGGCTSGHAISGMAAFSLSSIVTTGAMFAAGIAGAAVAAA